VSALIAILVLLLFGLVVFVVGAPLRRSRHGDPATVETDHAAEMSRQESLLAQDIAHDDLESAREAKYREIRDAEMDFRTGKLSREDYEAIDVQLRVEALEILNRLGDGDEDPKDGAGAGGTGRTSQPAPEAQSSGPTAE
jgi:hypothetical protein